MWEQQDEFLPISGGHAVEAVLEDVLARIDCRLYVQSCSPNCDFLFVHQTIQIDADEGATSFAFQGKGDGYPITYLAEFRIHDPTEEVVLLGLAIRHAVGNFADFKNVGRRLIDLEGEVREDLAHLLAHYHSHAMLAAAGMSPKTLKRRWQSRGWRREAWSLVSGIWLAMANMESLRRAWRDEQDYLADGEDVAPLLLRDFARDIASVEALDLHPVAETVSQVTAALNNQTAARAASWGALAGGVAGGATGILGG